MNLIESIIQRAKANKQRIVLPEATEERTLTAADRAVKIMEADGDGSIAIIMPVQVRR